MSKKNKNKTTSGGVVYFTKDKRPVTPPLVDLQQQIGVSDMKCQRTGKLGKKRPGTNLVLSDESYAKYQRELAGLESSFVGSKSIEEGVKLILKGLSEDCGVNTQTEDFKETPQRVSRLYMELFGANKYVNEKVEEILSTSFPADYSEMILVQDIKTFGLCPHHLSPVEYTTAVAYLPSSKGKGGRVLGLSKLPRLVQLLTSRPVLQETACYDVAYLLHTKLKAKGSICFMEGRHFCMCMRGAKQTEALTTTNSVFGIYRDKTEQSRQEFFHAINRPIV